MTEVGPELADVALRRATRAMVGTLRTSDVVARLDETRLAAVLPATPLRDALNVAVSLRRAVEEACVAMSTGTPLSASLGIAGFPDHGREPGPLLAAAREALARAQSQGTSRIVEAPIPANPTGLAVPYRAG
jgi:diguanylate cyclase